MLFSRFFYIPEFIDVVSVSPGGFQTHYFNLCDLNNNGFHLSAQWNVCKKRKYPVVTKDCCLVQCPCCSPRRLSVISEIVLNSSSNTE